MSDHEKHLAMLERVASSHLVLIEALLSQAQALVEITRHQRTREATPQHTTHMKISKRAGGE